MIQSKGEALVTLVVGETLIDPNELMSNEDFVKEVRDSFMNGWLQYVTLTGKSGYLPTEILIKKNDSGWHAYPVYEKEIVKEC